MRKVGLVGQGAQFMTLVRLLDATSTQILLWQPDDLHDDVENALPANVELVDLTHLKDVPLIFFLPPIHQARQIARQLGDVISGRQVIIHLSRSLEAGSLKSTSTVLQEETATQRFGFVTGPMIYKDIEDNHVAAAVSASLFPEVHDMVVECLSSPQFRIYRTDDINGAEMSAAYLRVLAVMAGIGHKISIGSSLQATLFARGLAEAARFVTYKGGYERTVFGLSGVGNFYADTHDNGSLAYRLGAYLVEHETYNPDAVQKQFGLAGQEFIHLLQSLCEVTQKAQLEFPILYNAHAIITGKMTAREALTTLGNIPARYE